MYASSSFMHSDLKDMFERARNDIRKRQQEEYEMLKQNKQLSNSKASLHQSSRHSGAVPLTGRQSNYTLSTQHQQYQHTEVIQKNSAQKDIEEFITQRNQSSRNLKIAHLKQDLRSILHTDQMNDSLHPHQNLQQQYLQQASWLQQVENRNSSIRGSIQPFVDLRKSSNVFREEERDRGSRGRREGSRGTLEKSTYNNTSSFHRQSKGEAGRQTEIRILDKRTSFGSFGSSNEKQKRRVTLDRSNDLITSEQQEQIQLTKTPTRPHQNLRNMFSSTVGSPTARVNTSPFSRSYYEAGPTAQYRSILPFNQKIENLMSKEEVYKIQSALLEAKPDQIKELPYSYVNELLRLSQIIQKVLGPESSHEVHLGGEMGFMSNESFS